MHLNVTNDQRVQAQLGERVERYVDDELEVAKKAGAYLQLFARTQRPDWAELMQGVNPHQGYGNSDEAHEAYDIAMGLYDWADTHWIACEIPQHYASAADLNTMLINSLNLLNHWLQQLTLIWDSSQKRTLYLETIPMVRAAVEKAKHGVVETQRQLKPAMISPSIATFIGYNAICDTYCRPLYFDIIYSERSMKVPCAATMDDEYDVQYLFEALLAIHIDDLRSEEPGPSVGGGYSRVDTYLPEYRCFIEFKMTRKGIDNNILRKQLADDFVLYGQDQRCDLLFVFVHNPENRIENPRGFETQMSGPTKGISNISVVIR